MNAQGFFELLAGNVSFTGLNISTTAGTSGTDILTSSSNLLMMIPQTFNNINQTITINFTDANSVNHTLSCSLNGSSWGRGQCVTYTVTMLGLAKKYLRNPLWYVAENNVRSFNTSTKVVTFETNPQAIGLPMFYIWGDALSYFGKQGSSYNEYWLGNVTDGTTTFKYHLPVQKEWYSIIPTSLAVFAQKYSDHYQTDGGLVTSAQSCIFGYNTDTKAGIDDWSYWSTYSTKNERYAIRYLGTIYCSVWKYQFDASSNVFTVTAKLIDRLEKDDATLATILSGYMNNGVTWWNTNVEAKGEIQRFFFAAGERAGTGSGATYHDFGQYISATIEANNPPTYNGRIFQFYFWDDAFMGYDNVDTWGMSVRLFRNK